MRRSGTVLNKPIGHMEHLMLSIRGVTLYDYKGGSFLKEAIKIKTHLFELKFDDATLTGADDTIEDKISLSY